MKLSVFLLFFLVSFGAQADSLKSKNLRALVCHQVVDTLLGEGLDSLLANVDQDCTASKESFNVLKSLFSKDFKKVISLTVGVDYESNTGVIFTGEVALKRAPDFDENTGGLKLGKWKVSSSKINYKLTEKVIRPLLEQVANEDYLGRGEVYVGKYDVSKFSLKSVEKEQQSEADEFNDQSKEDYIEYELDGDKSLLDDDADYCRMEMTEGYENIGYHGESRFVDELLRNFEKQGFIKASYSLDNYGGESEYCSQYNTVIYFIDGTVLDVFFDFNT